MAQRLQQQEIVDNYEDDRNNWAFGSIATVNRAFPQLSRQQVKEALSQVDTYTRFHPYRKSRDFVPYYVREKRHLIQADMCYLGQQYAEQNDGYYRMLVVIDVFTKFVWLRKLESLRAVHVVPAMRDILISMEPYRPKKLQTDRGSEFANESFAQLMEEFQIHHYFATSDRKAAVVERSNLTLQRILYKLMVAENSNRWIDMLDRVLKLYHNSRHRTIKMTPMQAEQPENQDQLRDQYEALWRKRDFKKSKPKFKLGDTVRVAPASQQQFRRGYHPPYSIQYFFVHQVLDNFHIPRYLLREHNKTRPLPGAFYEDEMVLYKPPPNKAWQLERVFEGETRGRGARKMVKVKYVGFPEPEWVLASSIENI